jgi:hypothetical protein
MDYKRSNHFCNDGRKVVWKIGLNKVLLPFPSIFKSQNFNHSTAKSVEIIPLHIWPRLEKNQKKKKIQIPFTFFNGHESEEA